MLILSLSRFFHLLATVTWIGGIGMILLVILPSAKKALESAPMVKGLMKVIAKRFTPMANISILVLIVTGIVIIVTSGEAPKIFTGYRQNQFCFGYRSPFADWNFIVSIGSPEVVLAS